MSTTTRPVPKRWNLNGVPVFQADVPGRVRAALQFRVGTADEPLHMAGVTHLIEHLALSGLGTQPYEYNGFVDNVQCVFLMSGTADQTKDFFAHVCASLRSLPADRVPTERRVIETEAAGHHQSSFRESLSLRYGANGFGTADYRQIGLLWMTPQIVQTWAAQHFTAGNAAAWVAGPVIPGLKIDLPPGPRLPSPALVTKNLRLPCVVEDLGQGATVSMIGQRSMALWVAMVILERRAMQRIRFNEGLSYSVRCVTDDLDGRTTHALATTDAMAEHVTKAASALLDVADVLSLSGPDTSELEFIASQMEEAISDPQGVVAEMQGLARFELLGVELSHLETRRNELSSLTTSEVAGALKSALDTAIVIMPSGSKSPRPHYAPYPWIDARPLPGTPTPNAYGSGERMVVGATGISLCDPEGRAHNIPWPEVAVCARWDDGTRLLIGRDGSEIVFRPLAWRNPQLVLGAIDGNTSRDRMIHADTPSPSADMPAPRRPARQGSVLGGRGAAMLLMVGGLLIAIAAAVALMRMSQGGP